MYVLLLFPFTPFASNIDDEVGWVSPIELYTDPKPRISRVLYRNEVISFNAQEITKREQFSLCVCVFTNNMYFF